MRYNQYDSDVPPELLRVDAVMYENGNFLSKFAGYPRCHNIVFCSLRDRRRLKMGSPARIESLLRIESVHMNGEMLI